MRKIIWWPAAWTVISIWMVWFLNSRLNVIDLSLEGATIASLAVVLSATISSSLLPAEKGGPTEHRETGGH